MMLLLSLLLFKLLQNAEGIVGGTAAYAGQFKFAAAITVETQNGKYFCGGTLISNEYILTAGQCVYGATEFTIDLGANDLSKEDPNKVIVATSEYFLHPEYNPTTLENDIAVIKLRMPIEFTNYLKSVDYLSSSTLVASSIVLAIGWGQISDSEAGLSNDLRWTQVSAISNNECSLTYGNQIQDNTVCAVGNYNEGSCYGDTGSALLQEMGRGYVMHVGIASFISANGCESTDPSGFVRTFPYRSWLKNITGI